MILITGAVNGTPIDAECDRCGARWIRPYWDAQADSLPEWGRQHDCRPADQPDIIGAYLDKGWTIDADGVWHPPASAS
jgi:hypothetical protein